MHATPPHQDVLDRPPPWPLELEPGELEPRMAWARRQGHPRYPWPEVPIGAWRAALGRIEEVTRALLAGEQAALPVPDRPAARALGVAAFTSGMGPLLGLNAAAGELHLEGERADELTAVLAAHLVHGRARAARIHGELTRASRVLAAAGIRPLVIKAGHTARVYFPEPGTRPAADLDLVVEPATWELAEAALNEAGYTRRRGQRRPPRSEWLAPGAGTASGSRLRSLELCHVDDPCPLDLHASLDRDFFGVRTVRLPSPRRPFRELGLSASSEGSIPSPSGQPSRQGRVATAPSPAGETPPTAPTVDVLEQPALLLLHLLHASEGLHGLTLVRLVELVLMARRDRASGALDDAGALALLEESGAARFVYPALTLAERLAGGTFPPALLEAAAREATPRMLRLFQGMSPAHAQRPTRSSLAESFMWCATPGEWVGRALHMALPAPAGSLPALARLYGERATRVLRGRVGLGG